MKLLIATKNPGKFAEIAEALKHLKISLVSLADFRLDDDVKEDGHTYEENATKKARYFYKTTKMPTLGEDSGINVDAFPGELGVQTRRWNGFEGASDKEWIKNFLDRMKNVPLEKRGAEFVCCASLILDAASYDKPYVFRGETKGVITQNLEAPLLPGIPISSCFKPEGCNQVYASLGSGQKNQISHRGKAMHAVAVFLKKYLEV